MNQGLWVSVLLMCALIVFGVGCGSTTAIKKEPGESVPMSSADVSDEELERFMDAFEEVEELFAIFNERRARAEQEELERQQYIREVLGDEEASAEFSEEYNQRIKAITRQQYEETNQLTERHGFSHEKYRAILKLVEHDGDMKGRFNEMWVQRREASSSGVTGRELGWPETPADLTDEDLKRYQAAQEELDELAIDSGFELAALDLALEFGSIDEDFYLLEEEEIQIWYWETRTEIIESHGFSVEEFDRIEELVKNNNDLRLRINE